jgi:hypothetical protein
VTACNQPGCTGTIEPDGYCSACGLAPAGLEKSYRALARLAPGDDRRIELVDLANDVCPRTRF